MLVKTSLLWELFHSICLKVLRLKWSCVFHPIAWFITLPGQKISFFHILFHISFSHILFNICTGVFLEDEIFTENWSDKIPNYYWPTIIDNVMFPYISLFCPTFTLWPRKSSIFPIFVIYWPRFCPFVYVVIVQYCIYCPIYRPILYLCFLGGNHPRNIYQKYGYHCRMSFTMGKVYPY